MRGDEGLPASWRLVPLAELLQGIETGKSFKCEERPPRADEIGVVKVSAVSWGVYQEHESKTCMDAERINPALFVQPGDFLFSRANLDDLPPPDVLQQEIIEHLEAALASFRDVAAALPVSARVSA